jgi:hypothetical protein
MAGGIMSSRFMIMIELGPGILARIARDTGLRPEDV